MKRLHENDLSRTIRLSAVIIVVLHFTTLLAGTSVAETILIGPMPYLSAADSPFDLSALGATFFLEDFEDGEFDTPGVFNDEVLGNTRVKFPSLNTDSVDGDAGPIDGSGTSGHSLRSVFWFCPQLGSPPECESRASFSFDADTLGFLPTAFGFVWTDGPPGTRLSIVISDANAETIAEFHLDETFGDSLDGGETAEDRFIGVFSDVGIKSLTIDALYSGMPRVFEMDHLQYGLLIPEPSTFVLIGIGLLVILGIRWTGKRNHSTCS